MQPKGMKARLSDYFKVLAAGGTDEPPVDRIAVGLAAYEQGDHIAAAMELTQGLVDQPAHLEARLALARIALAARQFKQAEDQACAAVEHHPRNPAVHTLLGEVLHAQRQIPRAESSYRGAIGLDPKFVEAHVRLGILQFEQGQMDEALKTLEHAIFLDKKDAGARYYIAQICLEHEDFKRALIQSHWVEKIDPAFRPIYLLRADIFEHLSDWRNAASELTKLDDLGLADAEVMCRLGVAQRKLGATDLARRAFEGALEHEWHCLEARFHLACMHEEAQRLEQALDIYRTLLSSKMYAEASREAVARIEAQLNVIDEGLQGDAEPPAAADDAASPGAVSRDASESSASPAGPAHPGKPRLADLVGSRPGALAPKRPRVELPPPPKPGSTPVRAAIPVPKPPAPARPSRVPPGGQDGSGAPPSTQAPTTPASATTTAANPVAPVDARQQMLQMQLMLQMLVEMAAQESDAPEAPVARSDTPAEADAHVDVGTGPRPRAGGAPRQPDFRGGPGL